MLTRLSSLAASDWISATKIPLAAYSPTRVFNCLPPNFEAYCKLFHPIYIVKSGGTLIRESSHGRTKGERVRWSQIASRYDLTFHPEINAHSFTKVFNDKSWPRYLLGPDEGTLDEETCGR